MKKKKKREMKTNFWKKKINKISPANWPTNHCEVLLTMSEKCYGASLERPIKTAGILSIRTQESHTHCLIIVSKVIIYLNVWNL